MRKKSSKRNGSASIEIVIIVFVIMIPFAAVLILVTALGQVQKKYDAVCNWHAALDIILGEDKKTVLDTVCKLASAPSTNGQVPACVGTDPSCQAAVIPPLPNPPGNNTCYLEDNCDDSDGRYYVGSGINGAQTHYPICKALSDKINLAQINPSIVNLDTSPKYVTFLVEQALEQASQSCGKCFIVTSAYRSCAQQDYLVKTLTTPVAARGRSNHNGGQAVDVGAAKGFADKYYCDTYKCSINLVNLLGQYGLKHFYTCNTLDSTGDYYITGPQFGSGNADCLHFSADGK